MKTVSKIILILILLGSLISCKSTQKPSAAVSSKSENFDEFYKKFHQNVNFQVSRIKFPLKGGMLDSFTSTKWTKSNWIPMKVPVYEIDKNQYNVLIDKTDTTFSQKVWVPDSGFSSEHKFELLKGKWYLVFARETNF